LEYGSPRLKAYDEQSNDIAREDALDQLEEARDIALQDTSRTFDATMTSTCAIGTYMLVTWCFGEAKVIRDDTSSPHHGALTSLQRC
jgi:hypothetical protein